MPHTQEGSLFLSDCEKYILNIRLVSHHFEYDIIARDGGFIMISGHELIDYISKPARELLSISNFGGRTKRGKLVTHLKFHIRGMDEIVFRKSIKSLYPIRHRLHRK